MSKVEKIQDKGSQSDAPFKMAFKEFLARTMGIDKKEIKTTLNVADVVVFKDGKPYKYFELKTSKLDDEKLKKNGYFGAASITEWIVAVEHPDDYYFVFMKGEKPDYEYMMVKAKDLYSYATVPPFAIDIKLGVREFIEEGVFKKLNEEKNTSIEGEVTHIKRKPRTQNQTSFGVNTEVVRRLCKCYDKEKKMYLAKLNKKKR